MIQKKICWVTGSGFFDVDEPIIPHLSKHFDIYWIVVREKKSWYTEEHIRNYMQDNNIKGNVINVKGRFFSIYQMHAYFKVMSNIIKQSPDLCYVNYLGFPFLWPLLLLSPISNEKLVYPCHDFIDHKNIPYRRIISFSKKIIFKNVQSFHFFSRNQLELFKQRYHPVNTFYAPLALKAFGEKIPHCPNTEGKVVFLFFGNIRENKGLQYLIDAANMLCQNYLGRFVVKIAGYTSDWDKYAVKIKNPSVFELDIRRIENAEIPDLFSKTDYLVLPYEDVTQSGPLLISYNYNVPVIASDHPGFREYINNGYNGFLFTNADSSSLFHVMENCIINRNNYETICTNLSTYVEENCSTNKIIDKYKKGIDAILNTIIR